jgi:DNA-3-methyladenine glycosylase
VARRRRLGRSFYRRDPRVVAPELLGKLLVRGPLAARLVEVEAYCGSIDPGSHTYRGQTRRNATMFGPPGGLYVYFTYGMHWCMNAVCGEEGEGVAVLLRAAVPEEGLELLRANRPAAKVDRDLCRGPARLCQAFGVDGTLDGVDLVTASAGITIVDDGVAPPAVPAVSRRIGLTAGAELPWRWCVPDDPHCSRPSGPAGGGEAGAASG